MNALTAALAIGSPAVTAAVWWYACRSFADYQQTTRAHLADTHDRYAAAWADARDARAELAAATERHAARLDSRDAEVGILTTLSRVAHPQAHADRATRHYPDPEVPARLVDAGPTVDLTSATARLPLVPAAEPATDVWPIIAGGAA